MIALPEERGFGRWAYRHRHGLIFLAVVLLVVGTVLSRVARTRRQALPAVIEAGRIEGLPALDRGDFDVARLKLGKAARAVEALGGQYEGADAIVQASKEADIFVDLVPRSLEEILDEAAREDSDDAWQQRFRSLYRGRSILFDDNVAGYRILSRSGVKNVREGRIDPAGFRLLESAGAEGAQAEGRHVYGARLASISLKGNQWVITLEPDSGVVMTHWEALRAFGWPVEGGSDEEGDPP